MKFRILVSALLMLSILTGCSLTAAPVVNDRAQQQSTHQASRSSENITQEGARNIALEHAGLTADQVTNLRVHLDYDDNQAVYEVHFRLGRVEYEYEINAETGRILSYDRDN